MKKVLLALILLSFCSKNFSQEIERGKTIPADSIRFMRTFENGNRLIVSSRSFLGNKKLYFNDSVILRETSFNLERLYQYGDYENFYCTSPDGQTDHVLYRISGMSGRIEKILTTKGDIVGILDNKVILIDQDSYENTKKDDQPNPTNVSGGLKDKEKLKLTISTFDLKRMEMAVLYRLTDQDLEGYEDINSVFMFPGKNKLLIQLGVYESGDYSDLRKVILDIKKRKISKYTDRVSSSRLVNPNWTKIHNICFNDEKNVFSENLILGDAFEVQGFCLRKSDARLNPYFKRGGVSFIPSVVDAKDGRDKRLKRVIIPWDVNAVLENGLFKVFYDSVLDKMDFNGINKDQMLALKQMIYAKHNSFFESEYDQAFFNLFSFYNNERKRRERLRDVATLLSNVDKRNLATIDLYLK